MTKAQQLGITEFPYQEFDANGNRTYYEDSSRYWSKREFDSNGNLTYYEDSYGDWEKSEYDLNGNQIYFENSDGKIKDNRPNKSKLRIVRTSDRQIFEVKKYIYAEGTEHHVWCDEWYGRHVIGQDCEWVN